METTESKKKVRFGLVGKNISYSFSKEYFTEKFSRLKLNNYSYENFDLKCIEHFEKLIQQQNIKGLNVTIPYKESVMSYLNEIDQKAAEIGAVNTIKFDDQGLKGYNTDAYGFKVSITPFLEHHHNKALILGTGGASKAIAYVLEELGISVTFVSRKPKRGQLAYLEIDEGQMDVCSIIINCTPLGTYPNVDEKPTIPYQFIQSKHLLYDLIYNPEKTAFLKEGESRGAAISNGLKMLQLQAEKAWEIWNS